MHYKNVKNPRWANAEQSMIDCEVDFYAIADGFVPFTASPKDSTVYGPEIFADCVAGKYGAIADYIAPPPLPPMPAEFNKVEAERRLAATDWVNQPDVYDPAINPHLTNRDEFIAYRAQVRAIAVNPTEGNLNWPVEPTAVWSQA